MSEAIKKIVIVGGGTAGWLAAAIVAAQHKCGEHNNIEVILVESSDIPSVGVGEGTWPTMKNTMRQIGINEAELFSECHAAFKQGGKFVNWVHQQDDFYYHPFTYPLGYGRIDMAPYVNDVQSFATETNFQHHICEAGLAPRLPHDAEYSGQCNYAYHLDAGAFADLLKKHCRNKLGVRHIVDTVTKVNVANHDHIVSIELATHGLLDGDLFVDCSGFQSLLLGKALNVPFESCRDVLFNDSALAIQVPYSSEQSDVTTHTVATGQEAGWTWDIGLTSRRGVGHVYSSEFTDDDKAEQVLRKYAEVGDQDIAIKRFKFDSGHRKIWWKGNCVGIGLSAGFVEPLEATAIMLVEISARFVAENLPADSTLMPITAKRFNEQMAYRWQRIIDFLKLHYMLTKRPEPYWQAHRDDQFIPQSLQDDLSMWSFRGPVSSDFGSAFELFPAASYQYVLYGMGFKPDFSRHKHLYNQQQQAELILQKNQQITQQMLQSLPPHREMIEQWLSVARK